jgi:low affinity Fe/Cu permease
MADGRGDRTDPGLFLAGYSSETRDNLMSQSSVYSAVAKSVARVAGRPITFTIALLTITVWLASGPIFGFSDTWQLVINTATTIVTFLMVFLIQNTQNRDTEAIHLKLDELIRVTQGAHNVMLDIEQMEEKTLDGLRVRYEALAMAARDASKRGVSDTDAPEL